MRFSTLNDWLAWQESLNPAEIDLGLDRVQQVLSALGYSSRFVCPLVTVAGTNGKGSVVAMLEAMAIRAGLRVATYTSPHIHRYNERIRLNGTPVSDSLLCQAFQRIDQARADVPLTYFEFGTLAAIDCFFQQKAELVILEVGLGGRLDAVNVMDADVALLTTVDIDHTDWLGPDRESIGREKAGVFRTGRLAVCGDPEPPRSVLQHANDIGATLHCLGRELRVQAHQASGDTAGTSAENSGFTPVENNGQPQDQPQGQLQGWQYNWQHHTLDDLPLPSLPGAYQLNNAALAITALLALQDNGQLHSNSQPLPAQQLSSAFAAIAETSLGGRFQKISNAPEVIVDVAHNVQAANSLAEIIRQTATPATAASAGQKTWCILAMLQDKDIAGVITALDDVIDNWCITCLEQVARAADIEQMQAAMLAAGVIQAGDSVEMIKPVQGNQCRIQDEKNQHGHIRDQRVYRADTLPQACKAVLARVQKNDRIIVAGSFYTVSAALDYFAH